jgi:hypothetical protein
VCKNVRLLITVNTGFIQYHRPNKSVSYHTRLTVHRPTLCHLHPGSTVLMSPTSRDLKGISCLIPDQVGEHSSYIYQQPRTQVCLIGKPRFTVIIVCSFNEAVPKAMRLTGSVARFHEPHARNLTSCETAKDSCPCAYFWFLKNLLMLVPLYNDRKKGAAERTQKKRICVSFSEES